MQANFNNCYTEYFYYYSLCSENVIAYLPEAYLHAIYLSGINISVFFFRAWDISCIIFLLSLFGRTRNNYTLWGRSFVICFRLNVLIVCLTFYSTIFCITIRNLLDKYWNLWTWFYSYFHNYQYKTSLLYKIQWYNVNEKYKKYVTISFKLFSR